MNLLELPFQVTAAILIIIGIAVTGCIAALHSWTRISDEQKRIKSAESLLTGDAAWNDAYPHDKLQLSAWLRQKGIKTDSHLGDYIRTCWSAWLGGRPASLTELHVLVARRERSHIMTRLSAGIAALLLVCGIVGTLSAIKPVLGNFRFDAVSTQTAEEQSDVSDVGSDHATARVNNLIRELGDAFWPSIFALAGTILVVSSRGLYALSLNRFTLNLDSFAVDTLIPRYRVPSLSEQYQEVKATLSAVTISIVEREGRFHKAVEQLENLVTGISPAFSDLKSAISANQEAAASLASGTKSIAETLDKNLGSKSKIHLAMVDLESVYDKTNQSLNQLTVVIQDIGQNNLLNQQQLESTIGNLSNSIEKITDDHRTTHTETKKAVDELKGSLTGISDLVRVSSQKAVEAGMELVHSNLNNLNIEQKKWHASSADELKVVTEKATSDLVKSGSQLAVEANKIASTIIKIDSTAEAAKVEITNTAKAGMAEIIQIGSETKSEIRTATEALKSLRATDHGSSEPHLNITPSHESPWNEPVMKWGDQPDEVMRRESENRELDVPHLAPNPEPAVPSLPRPGIDPNIGRRWTSQQQQDIDPPNDKQSISPKREKKWWQF